MGNKNEGKNKGIKPDHEGYRIHLCVYHKSVCPAGYVKGQGKNDPEIGIWAQS